MNKEVLINKAIREQYDELIGGLINITWDYSVDSPEYKDAYSLLLDIDAIVNYIYNEIINGCTVSLVRGYSYNIKEDIRFLGRSKIMQLIKKHVLLRLPEDKKDIRPK